MITNQRWYQSYKDAKARCNRPTHKDYSRYGGRGIKFLLTYEDMEFLWQRDNASSLRIPSLDRKENNNDYTLDNCQFIEHGLNANKDKPWFKKRQILHQEISQYIGTVFA